MYSIRWTWERLNKIDFFLIYSNTYALHCLFAIAFSQVFYTGLFIMILIWNIEQ